mmetsp:Transcript_33172/g.81520  ORF Transcript_33172/g.81520 Transcript_33172/m.81520 type:complete len:260 (-) Transcript_33172:1040-1819(-)
MPTRQERRKAERDAAKGAKRPPAPVIVNPLGGWSTQAEDPFDLFREVGGEVVKQRAAAGDAEAQWTQGSLHGLPPGVLNGAGGDAATGSFGNIGEQGTELLEAAAAQGHVYAMLTLASNHYHRKDFELAVEWATKGADAGLPRAMHTLAMCLERGRAWRRLTTRRRRSGTNVRQTPATGKPPTTSVACTASAAASSGASERRWNGAARAPSLSATLPRAGNSPWTCMQTSRTRARSGTWRRPPWPTSHPRSRRVTWTSP